MMMDEVNARAVLDVLNTMQGNPLTEQTLANYVNTRVPFALSRTETMELLSDMKARGWINSRQNDFDQRCWYITDAGQVVRDKRG